MDVPNHKRIHTLTKIFLKLTQDKGRDIRVYPTKAKNPKLAVIYFKLIPTTLTAHTNIQEVICQINTLNTLGYEVILVDRSCSNIPIRFLNRPVDIYIGIDGFASGKYYFNHMHKLQAKKNFIIMSVQPPRLLQDRLSRRQKLRKKLLNFDYEYTRPVQNEELNIFYREISSVDAVLAPSTDDPEFINELIRLNVPIRKLNWSTLEAVMPVSRSSICKNNFILLCGNDIFRKGVDFAIEIFKELPYSLYIFCPDSELVNKVLNHNDKPSNIFYEGFIDITSDRFLSKVSKSKFSINLSCTEGYPTSQLHCMKTGLVPIQDKEAGYLDLNFGLTVDITKEDIQITRQKIMSYINDLKWEDYLVQSQNAIDFVHRSNTLETYRRDFLRAIYE